MKSSQSPAQFIKTYPTGHLNTISEHIRALCKDYSLQSPPIYPPNNNGIKALIMPTSRQTEDVYQNIKQYMKLAEEYDMYFVALCSGKSNKQQIIQLANTFPNLKCLVIKANFNNKHLKLQLKTEKSPLLKNYEGDLAIKRNFGLLLARSIGWDSAIFVDDDLTLLKNHLAKLIDLFKRGAPLASYSLIDYPDNSVVNLAFQEIYGKDTIGQFLSGGLIMVRLSDTVTGFYPKIYNEDWLFMIPYILKHRQLYWAGTIRQDKYMPFKKSRAKNEEVGDLIGEGMLRLTISLIKKYPKDSYESLLNKLVKEANKTYWKQEILHRAVFIRELLNANNSLALPFSQRSRIQNSLNVSLLTLIGNEKNQGLKPEDIAQWVKAWFSDLKQWQKVMKSKQTTKTLSMKEILNDLGIKRKYVYDYIKINQKESMYAKQEKMDKSLIAKPHSDNPGVASTWYLSEYLKKNNISFYSATRSMDRLRYDKPSESLLNNKPLSSVVIFVQAYEDTKHIKEIVRNIITLNKKQSPIHCIIWIVPPVSKNKKTLSLYREYLVAQLILEASGTNIRILSCIGETKANEKFDTIKNEFILTTALSYWKSAIDSVTHPFYILNSGNEFLLRGSLADFINSREIKPLLSLKEELHNIKNASLSKKLSKKEELSVYQQIRWRLVTTKNFPRIQKSIKTLLSLPTIELMWAMKQAHISWVELDQLLYTTQTRRPLKLKNFEQTRLILCTVFPHATSPVLVKKELVQKLNKIDIAHLNQDQLAEIMIIVTGNKTEKEMNRYRTALIKYLKFQNILPAHAYFASKIFIEDISLNTYAVCKALLRYEHWEYKMNMPSKFLWFAYKKQTSFLHKLKYVFRKILKRSKNQNFNITDTTFHISDSLN